MGKKKIKFHWNQSPPWLRGGLLCLISWFIVLLVCILYRLGIFVLGPCECISPLLFQNDVYCKCNLFSSAMDPLVNGFLSLVTFPGSFIGVLTFNIGFIFLVGALVGLFFGKFKLFRHIRKHLKLNKKRK